MKSDLEFLRKISIKEFLEIEYGVNFRKIGKSYFCLSPLRSESNPSFSVNLEETMWYDFGIGGGGDIFKLVMKLKNCGFAEACKTLESFAGVVKPLETSRKIVEYNNIEKTQYAASFYNSILKTSNELFIRRYFKDMGLLFHSEMGVAEFRDMKGDRFIVFPSPSPRSPEGLECRAVIEQNGRIEHKLNADGQKIRKTIGKKSCWVLKRDPSKLLVTESVIDCLAGELLYGTHLSLCSINGVGNIKYVPEIILKHGFKEVFLALDGDHAGEFAKNKLIEIIPTETEMHIITEHIKAGVKDLYKLLKIQKQKKEESYVSRSN